MEIVTRRRVVLILLEENKYFRDYLEKLNIPILYNRYKILNIGVVSTYTQTFVFLAVSQL